MGPAAGLAEILKGGSEMSDSKEDFYEYPKCPKCGGRVTFDGKIKEEDGYDYHSHCEECGEEFVNRGVS